MKNKGATPQSLLSWGVATLALILLGIMGYFLFDFTPEKAKPTELNKGQDRAHGIYFVAKKEGGLYGHNVHQRFSYDDATIFFFPHRYGYRRAEDLNLPLRGLKEENLPMLGPFLPAPIESHSFIMPSDMSDPSWPLPDLVIAKVQAKKPLAIKASCFLNGERVDIPFDGKQIENIPLVGRVVFLLSSKAEIVQQIRSSGNAALDRYLQSFLWSWFYEQHYLEQGLKGDLHRLEIILERLK